MRAAAVKYQSLEAIGELNKVIYDHIWWNKPLALENTAHFDSRRTARSFTEDPSREEFWPVDVGDLMQEILEAGLVVEPDYSEAADYFAESL
jgi:hypothetical protein